MRIEKEKEKEKEKETNCQNERGEERRRNMRKRWRRGPDGNIHTYISSKPEQNQIHIIYRKLV